MLRGPQVIVPSYAKTQGCKVWDMRTTTSELTLAEDYEQETINYQNDQLPLRHHYSHTRRGFGRPQTRTRVNSFS